MRNKQTSKSSVLQRGVDYYIYTFAHIKKQWKHNKKLIKMANYRRQTMAMNRLGQPEKWDFLKVYLLGWFNFWTMWMYYLFKKSKKKVNSKFFLKKILFPMNRCWQDSGFSCSYFHSNRCCPTPGFPIAHISKIQRQKVMRRGYSLQNEIITDGKSGRSLSSLSKHGEHHLFSVQVVLAMYLQYDL